MYQFQHLIDTHPPVLWMLNSFIHPENPPKCNSFRFAKFHQILIPFIDTSTCGFYPHVHICTCIYLYFTLVKLAALRAKWPARKAGDVSRRLCVCLSHMCVCVRFDDGSCGCDGMMPGDATDISSAQPINGKQSLWMEMGIRLFLYDL